MEWEEDFDLVHTEISQLLIHRACGQVWRIQSRASLSKLNQACAKHLEICESK
jgi:hypothetical protein